MTKKQIHRRVRRAQRGADARGVRHDRQGARVFDRGGLAVVVGAARDHRHPEEQQQGADRGEHQAGDAERRRDGHHQRRPQDYRAVSDPRRHPPHAGRDRRGQDLHGLDEGRLRLGGRAGELADVRKEGERRVLVGMD